MSNSLTEGHYWFKLVVDPGISTVDQILSQYSFVLFDKENCQLLLNVFFFSLLEF